MKIIYYSYNNAYNMYFDELKKIVSHPNIKRVCDIGGGANPLLSLEDIKKYKLEYTILDISAEELSKAPEQYHKVVADITDPTLSINHKYDLVCSKFLAEHVNNGYIFHRNIFNLLNKEGYAFHYFPTLYNIPFLTNLLLPQSLSESILLFFRPHRKKEGNQGKFPAKYDWCFGPTSKQILQLSNIGYEIEKYIGFFGHDFYKRTKLFRGLDFLEQVKTYMLLKYPSPYFTQFAHLLLKKK